MGRHVFVRPAVEVGLGFAGLTALLAPWLGPGHITVVSLVYLLATLLVAARWGYTAGFGAAALANLVVNFFFVSPLHRFSVATGDNVAALGVFMVVAAVGALMLSRAREQASRAKAHQESAEQLLSVTRDVAGAGTPQAALRVLCAEFARALGARGCALLAGEPLSVRAATIDERSNQPPTRDELAVAAEAWRRRETVRLARQGRGHESAYVPVGEGERRVLRLVGQIDDGASGGTVFAGLVNELHATLRRAELDVEAARARDLEVAGEFKQLLLSGISHDLRTPLTAIKAAVSNLRDETVAWGAEDRAEFLGTIEAQTDRLTRTVANILAMQRIESGAGRPEQELIEVAPLLAEVALSAASAHRRMVTACAPEGMWVRADYGLLAQALGNLVENAAKYGDPGAAIRLEGSSAPGRVFLTVESAGNDIATADLPYIFERFYRGAGARNESGSGLGLALVKAIAEAAGGSVSAASEAGTTRFTISLPMAAAPS